jgi:hypothetical protein
MARIQPRRPAADRYRAQGNPAQGSQGFCQSKMVEIQPIDGDERF